MSYKIYNDFNRLDIEKRGVGDLVTGGSPKKAVIERHKPAKHGLFAIFNEAKLDGRTRLGKVVKNLRKELVNHCGGSPSIAERLLIDRVIQKTVKCHLYEMGLMRNPDQGARDHYLALANSLRHDLQALGIKKRGRDMTELAEYLSRRSDEHQHH